MVKLPESGSSFPMKNYVLNETGSIRWGMILIWLIVLISVIIGAVMAYNWKGKWAMIGVFVIVVYLFAIFKAPSSRGIVTWVFLLLMFSGVFYVFAWQSGWWDEEIVGRWENKNNGDDDGEGFFNSLKNLFSYTNLENVGDFKGEELEEGEAGIYVKSFKGDPRSEFEVGHPIIVKAEMDIGSLSPQSSEVSFDCILQDYSKDKADEVYPEELVLPPYPEKLPTQTISCKFDDGLSSAKRKDSKEIQLISSFTGFFSKSNISLELVEEETDESKIIKGKYSSGPVEIPITIDYPQPLIVTEVINSPYLEIDIVTDSKVRLKEFQNFQLYIPQNLIELVDNSFCSFDLSSSSSSGPYEIFDLKQEIYDVLNKECNDEECYDNKRQINVGCYFEVIASPEEVPVREFIKADATYDFEITSSSAITLLNPEAA